MALTSPVSPPCSSPSSLSEPTSTTSSSSIQTPTTPLSMARPLSKHQLSPRGSPPGKPAIDLPRSQSASKGGCWTCRIRRKKCDEQHHGDSCHTCIRLNIKCLGWGPKRPEWMRDKEAVDAYKKEIKTQLHRAGLIRGQRRPPTTASSNAPAPPPVGTSHRRKPYQRPAAPIPGTSTLSQSQPELDSSNVGFTYLFPEPIQIPIIPEFNSASTSGSGLVSSFATSDINSFHSPTFTFHTSSPSSAPVNSFPFEYPSPGSGQEATSTHTQSTSHFPVDVPAPSPAHGFTPLTGPSALQGDHMDHVFYYFENVRRLQYIYAGNAVTNVTFHMIMQDPRGAVTNAVCALAALHFKSVRVAQGLEAPDPDPEHTTAKFFHDSAYYQLISAKQLRGHYNERDAIAALHLVSFSLFSGGTTDWRTVLTVALDWLGQTGLAGHENPRLAMINMSFASRCALKTTMWLDVFSSLTLMRPPKFLALYRRLLAGGGGGNGRGGSGYWVGGDLNDDSSFDLRMESLSGCPDDVMLAIAEVSALAHWKDAEICNRSLSIRELVRRGNELERQLRQRSVDPANFTKVDPVPLHPNLTPMHLSEPANVTLTYVDENTRCLAANIFREAAILYLHTVVSDNYPGVPEINDSVGKITQLLDQLPPSEVDRSLVFPICIAGCMTDDPVRRNVLMARLRAQDQSIGNLLLTCAVMETVWQKRDGHSGVIDWRETMRDHHVNLLLV